MLRQFFYIKVIEVIFVPDFMACFSSETFRSE